MKPYILLVLFTGLSQVFSFSQTQQIKPKLKGTYLFTVSVENPNTYEITKVVEVKEPVIEKGILKSTLGYFAVLNGKTIPVELSDTNGDDLHDAMIFEASLPAKYKVDVKIYEAKKKESLQFYKKTQAELWHRVTGKFVDGRYVGGGNFYRFDSIRVPQGFMDHAYFIKYEGPGWESDKVGYRFYLDWRNANDVFGKKKSNMVLQDVGVDGYQTYHQMNEWGMDVLKVGSTLGIGSIAWYNGEKAIRVEKTDSVMCKISSDGLVRSQVKTWYYGWQTGDKKNSVVSLKSIDAGSRMTRELLKFAQPHDKVATGFILDKKAEVFEISSENGNWKALASFGKQSLADDNLGLAIIYPTSQNGRVTKDKINNLVVFEKPLQTVEYYFLAAWEQETNGIKTKEKFEEYLKKSLNMLEGGLKISVKK